MLTNKRIIQNTRDNFALVFSGDATILHATFSLFSFFLEAFRFWLTLKGVKRKIPSLLVDNCSSRQERGWKAFMRTRYRLELFKRKNPAKYDALTNKIIADLSEFEKAVSE